MRRTARAAVVGVAAAGAYLAGARVAEWRPVKGLGLLALGVVAGGLSTAAKARSNEQRFASFLANGGTIGGDLHITGRLVGDGGITSGANLDMTGNNINAVAEFNSDGRDCAYHGGISFIGVGTKAIWMHGGDIWLQNGAVHN